MAALIHRVLAGSGAWVPRISIAAAGEIHPATESVVRHVDGAGGKEALIARAGICGHIGR